MLANLSFSGSVFSPACLLGQSRLGVRCRHHHGFSKVVISQPRLRGCLGFSRNVIPWLPRQNGDPGQLQPQPSFSPPRLATSLSVASQGIADPQEAEPAVYSQLPTAWNNTPFSSVQFCSGSPGCSKPGVPFILIRSQVSRLSAVLIGLNKI